MVIGGVDAATTAILQKRENRKRLRAASV